MMNERRALFRQLQHYFETQLFGLYRWGSVKFRDAEPVVVERDRRGHRINQRSLGRIVEKVVLDFDGYTLSLSSPNEIDRGIGVPPAPAVELWDGPTNLVVSGPNTPDTWAAITQLMRENMEDSHGQARSSSG